jgi:TRAP-type mannitol/chloroaromatic compound transport system permease small subunit
VLQSIADRIDHLNDLIGRTIAWLTLGMVVVTFLVVLLRYAFSIGWISMQESVTYMHAMVFMLGAAYALLKGAHVRVDIFYQRASLKGRAWIDLLGSILLLVPFCVFLVWASWNYVESSWSLLEGSREAGGLPGVFLLKSLIPAMAGLMLLQGVSTMLRSIIQIRSRDEASDNG